MTEQIIMPIVSMCKTFADDTLLFIKIIDAINPEDVPNCDLKSCT